MKYTCYDWYGNKKVDNIDNLKDAVREALKLDCEVHDENGDIIYSKWDGWNGDYPEIEKRWFSVAEMQMVSKAKDFIEKTGMLSEWRKLKSDQFLKWADEPEWRSNNRWSVVYDWVNDGRFADVDAPIDIIDCLVEEWEETMGLKKSAYNMQSFTHMLNIKEELLDLANDIEKQYSEMRNECYEEFFELKKSTSDEEEKMRLYFEKISSDYETRFKWIKKKLPLGITKFYNISSTTMFLKDRIIFIGVNFNKADRPNCYIEITINDIENIKE